MLKVTNKNRHHKNKSVCFSIITSLHHFWFWQISKRITVKFIEYQLRRVHIIPVTKVSCIFVGIYREEGLFSGKSTRILEWQHIWTLSHSMFLMKLCFFLEDILTSDHLTDTRVWINTANLFGMSWIHFHLSTKEESLNKTHRDVTMHCSMKWL